MVRSIGAVLRRAREVRVLSAVEVARSAGISAAYLSKLESDAVKRPSPQPGPRADEQKGKVFDVSGCTRSSQVL
jgi:transcriptional regulator with XRE-family HTH domain